MIQKFAGYASYKHYVEYMSNDQKERLRLLDMQQSFLVQAPAGSGKTSVLVQRYLCALATVTNGPEEIIAITFTRKAAAQMRERILQAIELATKDAPTDPYMHKMWELGSVVLAKDSECGWNILDNPARLKIQTIDALCASITKQMPILSRFGAQPQIAIDPTKLYKLAVDNLLQGLNIADYPYRNGLLVLLQHLNNDQSKVKTLLAQILASREHWLPPLMQHRGQNDLRQFLEKGLIFAAEEAILDVNRLRPKELDLHVLSMQEPQSIDEWLELIDKLLTSEGKWRKTVTAQQGFHPPSKATNKEEKQQLQAAKDAMLAMLARLQPHEEFKDGLNLIRSLPPFTYTAQQWHIVEALIEILPVLVAQLNVVFRDQGKVDFVAVALAAISALQEEDAPTELALALDCKIKHILVDEFQDTSHIQYRLLEQLTANWHLGDGRTLFLVGDPMQSIYSFRQADVGLFIKARDNGIGNVFLEFVQLTTNFRATEGLVNWINALCTKSFPTADNQTLGAISYTTAIAHNKTAMSPISCINVAEIYTANEIVKIINETKELNQNASIAILVRARNHLQKILPALRDADIPFQGIDIESLSERPVIQDLLALTKALLHLDDRIAWLAILRAPWCGLSLVELNIIGNFDGTIFAAIQETAILKQLSIAGNIRVKQIFTILKNSIALLGRIDIKQTVVNAATKLGIETIYKDDLLQIDSYYKFLEQYAMQPEIYIPGFLEQELDKLFLQPSPTPDKDAIQIMTIHKAKGLEFDVVILPYLDKTTRSTDQELLLLEKRDYIHNYLLIAPIRAAHVEVDPIYKYMDWCKRRRLEFETMREFYVALTRAKQKLYCLASFTEDKNVQGMLKYTPSIWSQFVASTHNLGINMHKNMHLYRLPIDWFKEQEVASLNIAKMQTTLLPHKQTWVSAAGTILHRILYYIASQGVENIDDAYITNLPGLIIKYLQTAAIDESFFQEAASVIELAVTNMLSDPTGLEILSSQHKESYAEWDLTYMFENKFMPIRLDRVFLDKEDILWLIDYKLVLGNVLDEAIATYTNQLQEYMHTLKKIKSQYKIVAGLYFPIQKHLQIIT